MHHRLAPVLLLMLPGCELFEKGKDVFEGLTNPLVTQGIVLGVGEPPVSADLSGTGFEQGTTATVFLADATDVGQLEEAPVEGANVSFSGAQMGEVSASEGAGGTYTVGSAGGLTYAEGATWDLNISIGDDSSTAAVALPNAPTFDLAQTLPANQALSIDVTGQGFHSALVLVLGPSGVTYSNKPEGIAELHDFTQSKEDITTVEIPASAFEGTGPYAVGIAGMVNTSSDDISNMNTALSNVMAGKMAFEATTVQ